MLLEKILEDQLVSEFDSIPFLGDVQFITSRQDISHTQEIADTVVAVVTGWRSNDAFSLSPVSVPVTISIVSRVENDPNSEKHTHVCEEIINKISYWHKFPQSINTIFESDKFMPGEIRMDGGQSYGYDQTTKTWRDSISFTVRGSEKF